VLNHIRTLLLNRDGTTDGIAADFAAEHVPRDYTAVSLPIELQRIRRELFGYAPDAVGLNYRLRQFAAILHSPDVEPYTLADDSRVTYWPADNVCFGLPRGLQVEQIIGETVVNLLGELPPSRSGRLLQSWQVSAEEDDLLDIQPEQLPLEGATVGVTWEESLSGALPLPGASPLAFRLSGGVAASGTRFRLSLYNQYELQLADLPGRLSQVLTGEVLRVLFGSGTGDDALFRSWWFESDQLTRRMGGLLLALARRTDDIRKRR